MQPADELTGTTSEPVIYGPDDREDVYAFSDRDWAQQAAGFSAVMMPIETIDVSDPDHVRLPSRTLTDLGVCADERFADQVTAGLCSATLIAPDLVLTAGQCIGAGSCDEMAFVFDYHMTDADSLHPITSEDIFHCEEIVARQVDAVDFAVVRLDRRATGRTPARLRRQPSDMPVGRRLLVHGYPSGLPLKIEDGGRVRDGRSRDMDYFVANLDAFAGTTGAGVFDQVNRQLAGILVRGEPDYVADEDARCLRPNTCRNAACGGEDSTYALNALTALCETGAEAEGLCACGNGTCDTASGEGSATCAVDCGADCGDAVCNGDESPSNCTEDCGTCGNGVCDGGDSLLDCCSDCGCPQGDVCMENACIADPFPGDTCELPTVLAFKQSQNVEAANLYAHNDFEGSCVGVDGYDRVYQLEVEMPVELDAQVWGFDTGLYLRTACDDTATEIACNDDGFPPGLLGSRVKTVVEPGTYYLVVDGFDASRSTYELSVVYRRLCPDRDQDFYCDAEDGCPVDPDKIDPGQCGCGFNESDRDNDHVPDCVDPCPTDILDECEAAGGDDDEGDGLGDGGAGDDGGGCNASGDHGGAPGGALVSLWLLGIGAFGLRRRPRRLARQAR